MDGAVFDYFANVGLDVAAMVEERQASRDQRLAGLAARTENAELMRDAAERKLERLDARLAEGMDLADYKRAVQAPKRDLAAAEGALEDLGAEREALMVEPALADAEHEVLQQLAELRAAVADEVADSAGDLSAAQAALRRMFAGFTLTPAGEEHFGADMVETGTGYLLEPIVRPEMLALSRPVVPWHDVERVPLPARGVSNSSSPRRGDPAGRRRRRR